jgi:hypothetical protein
MPSTHEWIAGLPKQDRVVVLDDAGGRILYAYFFPQKAPVSAFAAPELVVRAYGHFCELYADGGRRFWSERPGRRTD